MKKISKYLSISAFLVSAVVSGGPAFAAEGPGGPGSGTNTATLTNDANAGAYVNYAPTSNYVADDNKPKVAGNIPLVGSSSPELYNPNDPRAKFSQEESDRLFLQNIFEPAYHSRSDKEGVVVETDLADLSGFTRSGEPVKVVIDYNATKVKVTPIGQSMASTKPKDSRYATAPDVFRRLMADIRGCEQLNGLVVHVILPEKPMGHTLGIEGKSQGGALGAVANGLIKNTVGTGGTGYSFQGGVTTSFLTTSINAKIAIEDPNGYEMDLRAKDGKKSSLPVVVPAPKPEPAPAKPIDKKKLAPRKKKYVASKPVAYNGPTVPLKVKYTGEATIEVPAPVKK